MIKILLEDIPLAYEVKKGDIIMYEGDEYKVDWAGWELYSLHSAQFEIYMQRIKDGKVIDGVVCDE